MEVQRVSAYVLFFLGSVMCRCPNRAIFYPAEKSCYYISNDLRLSWEEGKLKCQEMGGRLLVINSNKEEDSIAWLLRQRVDRNNTQDTRWRWWVGLSRMGDQWEWVNGQPADINTLFWHRSEPSLGNSGRNACVEFLHFLLNDVDCGQRRDVICELEPITTPPTVTSRHVNTSTPRVPIVVPMDTQLQDQRRYIFFGIICGIAFLAVVSIIAVICLSVRVRRLRRTYETGHPSLSPQSSLVTDSTSIQERPPQTLPRSGPTVPRSDPKPQHRFVLAAHPYAEPLSEQHPGYEKLNHFSPRYLEVTHIS